LGGVELDRGTARVAPGVRGAELTCDRGEPDQRFGLDTRLEQCRLGVLADVLGGLEETERATTLGVHDPLGHALAVELGVLLDQVVVLQQDRTVRASGQRVVVAGHRNTGIGRRDSCRTHDCSSSWWWLRSSGTIAED